MGIDAEMYVVMPKGKRLNEKEIRKLSYDAGCTFGADRFMRNDKDQTYGSGPHKYTYKAHHNISEVEHIDQDSNEVSEWRPPHGEQILRAHVFTRYYGPGYERGDFPFLYMLACWLEVRLPGCEIRYGGDSSGVLMEPWGPKERAEMLKHFAGSQGRDYFRRPEPFMGRQVKVLVCPTCKETMDDVGGGQGSQFWSCGGCGSHGISSGTKQAIVNDHEWRELSSGQPFGNWDALRAKMQESK